MKFSEHWLRTFVNPPLTSSGLADALTMAGLEVEATDPAAPAFDHVVVGEVIAADKHPDADRLTVCRVNTGGREPLAIVCGAPNVRAGIRVPVALAGAQLPGLQIKQAKVRGVESHGMLCSARELGLSEDAAGLLILAADAPVGVDIREYLDLDDRLFTLKLTPNRSDCLSVFGIAREVAAISGAPLQGVSIAAVSPGAPDRIEIVLDDPGACPRYCGRIIRDVDARAATPNWMLRRIERSGLRGISAIVDVTNYVMLELGQPLHAFDRTKIHGAIHARRGRPGEKLKLLNEQEILLDASLLVIADDRQPLALAGIMGGMDSAVDAGTRDILLESAFFSPTAIAGKSRVLGFGSDSSHRFERGVDFAATAQALEYATRLIIEICGGKAGPVCEAKAALPERKPVTLRRARVRRVLGIDIPEPQITEILERLRFDFATRGEEFSVTPPSYRFDLAIEEDLIEEIARIYGYDNIPAAVPVAGSVMLPASESTQSATVVRGLTAARDYQEIVSYSFVDRQWEADFCGNSDPVALKNPIAAQMGVMRSSLIGSLVDRLCFNLSHQQSRVRLFEIGRCFARRDSGYEQVTMLGGIAYGDNFPEQWGVPARKVDFYDVKSDVEALIAPRTGRFEAVQHPALHPGRSARVSLDGVAAGWLGELHPRWQQKYDLSFAPMVFELNLELISERDMARYQEISRLPLVRRDLAVVVDENVSFEAIISVLNERRPAIVSEVALFDVYRGKGIDSDKKSLAFRVLLQDTRKTLTDAEVEAAVGHLLQVLQEEFRATLRN